MAKFIQVGDTIFNADEILQLFKKYSKKITYVDFVNIINSLFLNNLK